MMTLPKKLEFLLAPRFWALIIGAVAFYAQKKGWIGDAEMLLITTIMAGFIGVQTLDYSAKKQLDIARINADVSVKEAEKSVDK